MDVEEEKFVNQQTMESCGEELDLPAELWAHVASFLPVRDLAAGGLSLTCRRLNELCALDPLWLAAFRRKWPSYNVQTRHHQQGGEAVRWKDKYCRQVHCVRAWQEGRCTLNTIKVEAGTERLQLVGDEVFTCGVDKSSINCHAVRTGVLVRSYTKVPPGSNQTYMGFHYNQQNGCLATADFSTNAQLLLFDPEGNIKAQHASSALNRGMSVWAVQSDNEKVIVGAGREVQLWDLASDQVITPTQQHTEQIRSLKFVGNTLLTGGALGDNSVLVWDVRDMKNPVEKITIGCGVWCIDFDGDTMAFGTCDVVHLWDMRVLPKEMDQLKAHEGHINMVQFDSHKLVTAANDKKIKVWDAQTRAPWATINADHVGMIRSGMFADDVLAAGGNFSSNVLVVRFSPDAPVLP